MTSLYITADTVGVQTGGGVVTRHESEALRSLGPCQVWDRVFLDSVKKYYNNPGEPWQSDANAYAWLDEPMKGKELLPKIAHFYAGTFARTVERLRERGCKVTYTAAAHDIGLSRGEHEKFGIPFQYPHLTNPELWQRYVAGYLAADVLICPSRHSANVMRSYGATNRVEVIPHGVDLPEEVAPLPKKFTVGYLGSYGPDKGVVYLLHAWKQLSYPDAVLVLAGRDSQSEYVLRLVEQFGGGNIILLGWVKDVSTFYGGISLYVQPSVTEGFGIEVLEAMAHGRPVVCSTGAGAHDVMVGRAVRPCNPSDIAQCIHSYRDAWDSRLEDDGRFARERAGKYTWDKIRQRYIDLWKELLV